MIISAVVHRPQIASAVSFHLFIRQLANLVPVSVYNVLLINIILLMAPCAILAPLALLHPQAPPPQRHACSHVKLVSIIITVAPIAPRALLVPLALLHPQAPPPQRHAKLRWWCNFPLLCKSLRHLLARLSQLIPL